MENHKNTIIRSESRIYGFILRSFPDFVSFSILAEFRNIAMSNLNKESVTVQPLVSLLRNLLWYTLLICEKHDSMLLFTLVEKYRAEDRREKSRAHPCG